MTQQGYNSKRQKCWEEYLRKQESEGKSSYSAFLTAFDYAYALGKQEKDTETKSNGIIKARRKSDGEIIEVREWSGASDVIYSSPDMNHFYQASDLDFNVDADDAVIQGWVARDSNESLYLFCLKPERVRYLGSSDGVWMSRTIEKLDSMLFPDLTWDSDPIEVELIIKRKKKNL